MFVCVCEYVLVYVCVCVCFRREWEREHLQSQVKASFILRRLVYVEKLHLNICTFLSITKERFVTFETAFISVCVCVCVCE